MSSQLLEYKLLLEHLDFLVEGLKVTELKLVDVLIEDPV